MNANARIASRMYALEKLFLALRGKRQWPSGVVLNHAILENLVERYFIDLDHAKAPHNITRADAHKRAAFTIKWISRLRPIQIESGTIKGKELQVVNELFAVYAGLEHLAFSFADADNKWLLNFLFTLRYRDFHAEAMASEMYLLETRCQQGSPD